MKDKNARLKMEDVRVRKSKDLILKTTWDLLSQNGLSGVSVDEVSRQSGVAKTTIYRHWKTRSDLLIAACSQPQVSLHIPDKGTIKDDLILLMNELAKMLQSARWAAVLPSVIDSAEREEAIAALHSDLQKAHAQPFREVIERAIKRGQLPNKTESPTLIAMLLGPLFYRRWFSRERIDKKFVSIVVESVLGL